MTFQETKESTGIRIYNVILGLTLFLGAFYVLINPKYSDIIKLILASLIALLGLSRSFNGLFEKDIKKFARITKIIIGFAYISLAILIFVLPEIGENLIITLISISLIVNGLTKFLIAYSRKNLPKMIKTLLSLLGLLMVGLASFVLIILLTTGFERFEDIFLIGILALTIQLAGIGRLISGISGYGLGGIKTKEERELDEKKDQLVQEKKEINEKLENLKKK